MVTEFLDKYFITKYTPDEKEETIKTIKVFIKQL